MNGSFEMYYNQSEKDFYFQCGLVDLKENEGICSFNIDSVFRKILELWKHPFFFG